jgi:hypothetical protein
MAGEEAAESASVSGSQGVQAGSGNTQINNWMAEPQLDIASLCALHPHAALARLRRIPYENLVNLFADPRASSDDVARILRTWLETDEAKPVAILADLREARAQELLRPLVWQAPWLARLPEAANATNRFAAKRSWKVTQPLRPVFTNIIHASIDSDKTHVEEKRFDGYVLRCDIGSVFWREDGSIISVSGPIGAWLAKFEKPFGFPLSAQQSAPGPAAESRVFQEFTAGVVCSSEHGVYFIHEIALDCYKHATGNTGWLGFPVANMIPFKAPGKPGPFYIQKFEGGMLYLLPDGEVGAAREMTLDIIEKAFSPGSHEARVSDETGVRIVVRYRPPSNEV